MSNTPTDAEIDEVTLDVLGYAALDKETNDTARMIARAVLAKWGTQPQAGAVPQGWKAVPVNPTPEMWKAAKTVPDPNPPYPPHYGLAWDAMLAASPTPPAEQQAAPKAAPGEQDDHQILAITTAYEQGVGKGHQAYNSGKEIANPYSPAYRCDLAWQYGYKEGKEQAQREAKAAPQQEAQEPAPSAAVFGLRLVPVEPTDQMVQAAHHIDLSYMPGQEGADRAAIYRAMIAAAPQPAPAPVSEPIDQLERALAIIGVVGAIDGHDVVRRESVLEIARRAALAAQGGK